MAQRTTSKAAPSQIKPAALRIFHTRLARWYETHGRHDLPWRQTADPYHIWLSEVMLQQTQVATVRARFYFPFLKTFPTVEALAAAPREAVMKAWEGLGYYRRAGFLHEAAKQCVMEGGIAPFASLTPSASGSAQPTQRLIEDLLKLPGIGKNTAHAILAFAYRQPVAILEANVKRVVARIFALEAPSDAQQWAGAEALLNRKEPFDYNQAMMDIGSMVCTPKNPDCAACPAKHLCLGKSSPESYPAAKAKKQVPTREITIHVRVDNAGRFFLEARDAKLLGGLYGFAQSPHAPSSRVEHGMTPIGTVSHAYSHFKVIGHVLYETQMRTPNSDHWFTRAQIKTLPLSKLDHKVLALVENCHSGGQMQPKAPALRRKH